MAEQYKQTEIQKLEAAGTVPYATCPECGELVMLFGNTAGSITWCSKNHFFKLVNSKIEK